MANRRGVGSGTPTSQWLRLWVEGHAHGHYTQVTDSWNAARPTLDQEEFAAHPRAVEAVGWSLALTKSWSGLARLRADLDASLHDPDLAAQLGILETWRLAIQEGRYDASLLGARRLQSALMRKPSSRLLAQALKVEGVGLLRLGRYAEAETLTRRAEDLFALCGDSLNVAHCATNLGLILNARGEIRAAREELKRAVGHLTDAGAADERLALAQENLAITEAHLGNEAEARALYEAALRTFEAHELRSEQVTALNGLGHCARLRGDLQGARQRFEEALRRTDDTMPRQVGLCHEFLGQIAFDAGRFDTAEAHQRQALAIAAAMAPDGDLMVESSWRLAEALAAQKRCNEASEHLERGRALCLRSQDRRELGCVERSEARLLLAQGHLEPARASFLKARRTLQDCGRLFEAALTGLASAEAALDHGDPAAAMVDLDALQALVNESLPASTWLLDRAQSLRRRAAARTPGASAAERYGFVTGDGELLALLEDLPAIASTPYPVLLEGESGTGKELLARALHEASRRSGAFVAVNCAAIPRDLFESELFGHARGAFSGAGGEKAGLLEQAADGTLLLDEIGEMPRELQAKLLRFLDDGKVRRIGELRERPLRLKVVAATNRPLQREVTQGLFRSDLYHRLAVHHLYIKPLRQRRGDVGRLARHILRQENLEASVPLTASLLSELETRSWSGNVRELRNELIRKALHSTGSASPEAAAPETSPSSLRESRRTHERQRIQEALADADNLTVAARHLGMHVTTLRRKMRSLGVSRPS